MSVSISQNVKYKVPNQVILLLVLANIYKFNQEHYMVLRWASNLYFAILVQCSANWSTAWLLEENDVRITISVCG